jgi:hypothetical protein
MRVLLAVHGYEPPGWAPEACRVVAKFGHPALRVLAILDVPCPSFTSLTPIVQRPGFPLSSTGEVGPAVAVTAFCIAGIVAAAFGLQIRAAKGAGARERLIDPSESPVNLWRAVLRTVTTGILALIAALSVGMTFTACAPVAAPNAVVFGVFTTLVVWAGLAVWAVTDGRLMRTGAILAALAAVAYGLAVWPGVCG